jgi:hypothetical protein
VLIIVLPAFPDVEVDVPRMLGVKVNGATPTTEIDSEAFTVTLPPLPFPVPGNTIDDKLPPSFNINRLVDRVTFPAFPEPNVALPKTLGLALNGDKELAPAISTSSAFTVTSPAFPVRVSCPGVPNCGMKTLELTVAPD